MKFGNWGKKRLQRSEITPGGSEMLRYAEVEPLMGIPPESADRDRKRRERVYDELFGPSETVYHEVGFDLPHVDVYTCPPGYSGRDFYTLVTGGMSDLSMRVPRGVSANRAELVMYVSEPKEVYLKILRFLAHFPHDHRTWFGHGHTFPNGQPPQPYFESSVLDTILFLDSIVRPDATLEQRLKIEKDPVHLLWVVPITTAESELKLQKGTNALLDLFDRYDHPFVLDEKRRSFV